MEIGLFHYNPRLRILQPYGLRLGLYSLCTIGLILGGWWLALSLGVILTLGLWSKIRWLRFFAHFGVGYVVIFIILLQALPLGGEPTTMEELLRRLLFLGERCLVFVGMLMASHWLGSTTTVLEVQRALYLLTRVFGRRAATGFSLMASLTLAFLPWVQEQVVSAREAASLRMGGRRRGSVRTPTYRIMIPIVVRVLEKSRHSADALTLRQ